MALTNIQKFDVAVAQYTSVDKNKCDVIPTLVQGFYVTGGPDKRKIIPFSVNISDEYELLRKNIIELKEYIDKVCLCQKYICYHYDNKDI